LQLVFEAGLEWLAFKGNQGADVQTDAAQTRSWPGVREVKSGLSWGLWTLKFLLSWLMESKESIKIYAIPT
jgi:hypothetical protein